MLKPALGKATSGTVMVLLYLSLPVSPVVEGGFCAWVVDPLYLGKIYR